MNSSSRQLASVPNADVDDEHRGDTEWRCYGSAGRSTVRGDVQGIDNVMPPA